MNRGLLPLTYSIKKKDLGGSSQTYLDGVLMHISYTTKPERQLDLQKKLNADDNAIRTITVLLK
jgi:ribosomal protein S6